MAYVLKDDLKQLWQARDPVAARDAWHGWVGRALASGILPLMRFATRLQRAAEYIINHARYQLHTGLLEGMNNKIKVLKRMAYGYRDDEYFFLKIRRRLPRYSAMNLKLLMQSPGVAAPVRYNLGECLKLL